MKSLKRSLTALCMIALLASSGCSFFAAREAYLPEGTVVEVAEPGKVEVYITNAETGKREKRTAKMWPGWYVVRPRVEEFGNGE